MDALEAAQLQHSACANREGVESHLELGQCLFQFGMSVENPEPVAQSLQLFVRSCYMLDRFRRPRPLTLISGSRIWFTH